MWAVGNRLISFIDFNRTEEEKNDVFIHKKKINSEAYGMCLMYSVRLSNKVRIKSGY